MAAALTKDIPSKTLKALKTHIGARFFPWNNTDRLHTFLFCI